MPRPQDELRGRGAPSGELSVACADGTEFRKSEVDCTVCTNLGRAAGLDLVAGAVALTAGGGAFITNWSANGVYCRLEANSDELREQQAYRPLRQGNRKGGRVAALFVLHARTTAYSP